MCNLSQSVEEKGIQKGIQQGRQEGLFDGILLSVKNLMKNKGMPAEEALATLEVSKTDWPKYRELLAGQS